MESGGGLTLRHVSGTVDTHEHERNPREVWGGAAESRGGADRLVARGIEGGHALDVVPEVLGDVVELAVWEHGGRREVVGQSKSRQRDRSFAGEVAFGHQRVEQIAVLEVREFCRELEDLLPAGEPCGDFQDLVSGS